jgi:16S rRNA (uracil1498-N3)-methyltransferase
VGGGRAASVITLFAAPGSLQAGATIELDDVEAHHLKVRRGRAGQRVRLVDGSGTVGEALLEIRPAGIQAVVASVTRVDHPVALTLVVGAGDRDRFALLVEKAVELGATEIVPLEVERAVTVASRLRGRNMESLRRRARDAMKQCGSAWELTLQEPQSLESFFAQRRTGAAWLADPEGEALIALDPSEAVTIAIGPEGGFTDSESKAFLNAGFRAVSLGPYTMRFETAGLVAMAAVWQARRRGEHG